MAERIALHLLRSDETLSILTAIAEAKEHLVRCQLCGTFTDASLCLRCADERREQKLLCVVEEVGDMEALERSGAFRGRYHLLGGVLSPLDGIGPKQLRIDSLLQRLKKDDPRIEEVVVATNPTVEGEATATYLAQIIQPLGRKITRLAYGLPSGASLEYADELTLARAYEGRTSL
jgi:recombination protein RecR